MALKLPKAAEIAMGSDIVMDLQLHNCGGNHSKDSRLVEFDEDGDHEIVLPDVRVFQPRTLCLEEYLQGSSIRCLNSPVAGKKMVLISSEATVSCQESGPIYTGTCSIG
ncbi:hypothetical protein F3Y22_tig00109972pilonHSYRG00230 [Hibiscus syriacus]|uniref:Uncharacterized protein n=1 Tax=Hibiscus syriacus TaxID=106335 RepID=A0A6A3BTB5_HIBSY|nr:hypothetical protein F3Y22_tig00109972pilonHSYRG00230 [Hibiscus syriacus]